LAQEKVMEYTNSEITNLIDEHIHSERDRAILKRRLVDGIRYEELAEEFELSVRQVKNIVYKAEEKLFKYLHV
jgi:DNA-directed RNA polymerase specialized sigma24 family protein